jgi:hypothetical protein
MGRTGVDRAQAPPPSGWSTAVLPSRPPPSSFPVSSTPPQGWTGRRCAGTWESGTCGSWCGGFAGAGHSRLLAPGGNRNTSCQARARNPPLTAAMLGQRRSGQLRPPPNCSGRQHCSALSRLMPTATAARLTGQQRRAVWSGRANSISSPSLPRKPAIPPPRHSTWAHSVRALAVLARSYRRRVQNS